MRGEKKMKEENDEWKEGREEKFWIPSVLKTRRRP
jgi:hypothetical protein